MTDRPRTAAPSLLGRTMLSGGLAWAAACLAACSDGDSGSAARAEVATPPAISRVSPSSSTPPAPDFALQAVGGNTIRLADYEGKVVLLDFWATWCGPCRAAIPHLNELYAEHKNEGFEILGISVDQDRPGAKGADLVAAFAKRIRMDYPLAMANREIVRAYGGSRGIESIPTAFLIDRQGRVRQRYVGLRPKSTYEREVVKLLAEPAPTAEAEEESI